MCPKDYISEEDFNQQMAKPSASPRRDSPGDSESDTAAEFMMGLDYIPTKKPVSSSKGSRTIDDLPETARVVDSEIPSPSQDFDKDTDTH